MGSRLNVLYVGWLCVGTRESKLSIMGFCYYLLVATGHEASKRELHMLSGDSNKESISILSRLLPVRNAAGRPDVRTRTIDSMDTVQ